MNEADSYFRVHRKIMIRGLFHNQILHKEAMNGEFLKIIAGIVGFILGIVACCRACSKDKQEDSGLGDAAQVVTLASTAGGDEVEALVGLICGIFCCLATSATNNATNKNNTQAAVDEEQATNKTSPPLHENADTPVGQSAGVVVGAKNINNDSSRDFNNEINTQAATDGEQLKHETTSPTHENADKAFDQSAGIVAKNNDSSPHDINKDILAVAIATKADEIGIEYSA